MPWVELPSALGRHTGQELRLELPGSTVGEVLGALLRRHPALEGVLLTPRGGLPRTVSLFVGEDDVRTLRGLETPLEPGARLLVVSAVAGG